MIAPHFSFRAMCVWLFCGAALISLSGSISAWAQDAPTAAPAQPKKEEAVTFQEALSRAQRGFGLALAIDGQDGTRSREDLEKKRADTVTRVAEAFGKTTRYFGGVMAIGPQTYTELATDFSKANAFADMPPHEAFTLLIGSLDDRQREALASKAGLGFGDLTTPTQKQMFLVLLPENAVTVSLRYGNGAKNLGVLRDNPGSARFRVAQEVKLSCEAKNQNYGTMEIQGEAPTPGPKIYDLNSWENYKNLDKVNGIVIRRDVPNRPKRSDLNYDAPRLQALIAIKDLKTIGDLTARIAERTKIEMYAGSAYEKRPLIWLPGSKESASASELLRALAFCVAGTYRRVGTAFVLTEDLMGVGTRRQMIQDFEEACEAERHQAVKDAEKALKANPAQRGMKLNSFGDPLAMTPEQEKMPSPYPNYHQGLAEAAAPRDDLTAAQQSAIQNYEAYVKAHPDYFNNDWKPDFEKKIHVVKSTSVQMVITGLDGVVATDFGGALNPLFQPEPKKQGPTADDLKMFENMPKWSDAAKAVPRRAVICRPRTMADVDAALLGIAARGFNQMWLVVFQDGKARIPGTPFALDAGCNPKEDILTYAIAEGKKKGIKVCPVANVYAWGADAPKDFRLWTLRGEDTAQSAIRRFKINALMPPANTEEFNPMPKNAVPSPAVFVDLTDPGVQNALVGLFKAIAGHAGEGETVCRNMTPEGFTEQNNWRPMRTCDDTGYNPALRLTFLRKYHDDPLDWQGQSQWNNYARAKTELRHFYSNGDTYAMTQNWHKIRADALKTAWQSLYESVWSGAGEAKPALLIAQDDGQGFFGWYDAWSDPKAPLPNSNLYNPPTQAADGKPGTPPKPPTGILLLSKQAPSVLPKEMAKYDWMDIQMKILEFYKQFRTWDGIAIEE